MEGDSTWHDVAENIDYSSTSYTVSSLRPFTSYSFRIKATNDIGSSEWSESSSEVRTLPAAPAEFPSDIKVRHKNNLKASLEDLSKSPDCLLTCLICLWMGL